MRCGVGLLLQSYDDWDRYEARRFDEPSPTSDTQVYTEELRLGLQAEPLGFDSVWTVEHHFTPYTMCPNPLQFLTYFAAKTERIDVGTMVVVLPWNDPIRVVEQVSMLDHMLGGRRLRLGVGRGTAKVEFDGLGIDLNSSRERFLEALEVVRKGLTQPVLEHDGKYFTIPPVHIRPRPRSADIVDHMYMAWGSPASVAIAAENGLRPLVVPQKHWHLHVAEMEQFNQIRAEVGLAPVKAALMLGVYVNEDPEEAERIGRMHMEQWTDSSVRHYGFLHPEDLRGVKGYEEFNDRAAKLADDSALGYRATHLQRQLSGDVSELVSDLTESHVWGTPDSVADQLRDRMESIGGEELIAVFKTGNMSYDVAHESMQLFAEKVRPRLE